MEGKLDKQETKDSMQSSQSEFKRLIFETHEIRYNNYACS